MKILVLNCGSSSIKYALYNMDDKSVMTSGGAERVGLDNAFVKVKLANGEKHDGRAPDYDDWSTIGENGLAGLNGDILIWYPVLGRSFELSSMGIRVDKESLLRQLKLEGKEERESLYFHQKLLNGELPLSIGGGIGQSRLCMVLLHKGHIGEIQASIWPDEMRAECKKLGMQLI